MSTDRMQISLEEFIKYILKKWKKVTLIILIVTTCFVAGAIYLGDEITVPHSEEYLRYEQELEWHESYLKESILMNLDPLSIHERTLFLKNIEDKKMLKDYALSLEIWEAYDTENSKKYISELVKWNKEKNSDTIELVLWHASEEECLEAAEYLKEQLLKKDSSMEIVIGSEKIVIDEKLQEEHLRWYSRIDYVNSLLLGAQAGYTLKVSKTAAVVTGVLAGGVLAFLIELVSFMIKRGKSFE